MSKSINELAAFFERSNEFVGAVEYSQGRFGFSAELIEKDYLCSLILRYFYQHKEIPIIFKGGTLLAKVYAGFYRMSEDLDFTISIAPTVKRNERSAIVKPLKDVINSIPELFQIFVISKPLTGSNESRQYNAEIIYKSKFSQRSGRILIDIGLRETYQQQPLLKAAGTLLRDPFTGAEIFPYYQVKCLTVIEAYAEKMRAALSREKLAIRDFYDLYFARKNNVLDFTSSSFLELVKRKLELPDTKVITFDSERISLLTKKIDTDLIPTLNQSQDDTFDLDEVINWLKGFREEHLSLDC